jgi:hypothetical protein
LIVGVGNILSKDGEAYYDRRTMKSFHCLTGIRKCFFFDFLCVEPFYLRWVDGGDSKYLMGFMKLARFSAAVTGRL